MKKVILALTLMSICIISQSQTDAELEISEYSSIDISQIVAIDDIDNSDINKTVLEYRIYVANSGEMKLTDVTANVTLPAGMRYDHGYVIDDKDNNVSLESLDLFGWEKLDESRTSVVFNIGDLQTDSMIRIRLFAKHAPGKVKETDYYTSEASVCAKDPRGNPVCQTAAQPS